MQLNKKSVLWESAGALGLCCVLAGIALAGGAQKPEVNTSVPASVVIKAINVASSAQAGRISGVEVESEKGQTTVSVEILAADGQKYEVNVEAASGKVLSVEKMTTPPKKKPRGAKRTRTARRTKFCICFLTAAAHKAAAVFV